MQDDKLLINLEILLTFSNFVECMYKFEKEKKIMFNSKLSYPIIFFMFTFHMTF